MSDLAAKPAIITEDEITLLVETFYARVMEDPLLAPIFASRIHSWDAHLSLLRDFWSSVLLASGRYKGHLMLAHFQLQLQPQHFARWIALFRATAKDVLPLPAAELAILKAEGLATNMQRGLQIYGMLDESGEA
ncbi:hemoglobin [Bryocella elongata]|uniref:Hemoglobin n=1 Tax=Bryocella elongata TaxID=863522 RepID=A0A1H6BH30_9BACT|nr:group III truncated hemoglobin [Bryocella elongata]SEG60069.1 hemoglobin [Bryocella elongata]